MKIRHILKSKDFVEILKNGEKLKNKLVSAHLKRETGGKELSVGVIVSKKCAPKAVTRNYLRRIIYAYFREAGAKWAKGTRIVVRLSSNVSEIKKRPLSQEVRKNLARIAQKAQDKK
ncbi:MAG: ribonuclease P protein component [Candidatus Omnitrophota bacterium]